MPFPNGLGGPSADRNMAYARLSQGLQRRKTMANIADQNRAKARGLASMAPSMTDGEQAANIAQLQQKYSAYAPSGSPLGAHASVPAEPVPSPLRTLQPLSGNAAHLSVPPEQVPGSPAYSLPAMSPGYGLRGGALKYPAYTPQQQSALRQQDLAAEQQQVGLLSRAATPTHFGGTYGAQPQTPFQNQQRQQADSIIGGSAVPGEPDPRYAGMALRFPQGMVTPNPTEPTALPTNDMQSRNEYGINRPIGLANLRPTVDPAEAAATQNGTVGMYGDTALMRRNDRNVLVGGAKNQSSIAAGVSPGSLIDANNRRDSNSRLMAQAQKAGIDTNSEDWKQKTLASNRSAFQGQQVAQSQLKDLRRAGVKPTDKRYLAALEKVRGKATTTESVAALSMDTRQALLDPNPEVQAKANRMFGFRPYDAHPEHVISGIQNVWPNVQDDPQSKAAFLDAVRSQMSKNTFGKFDSTGKEQVKKWLDAAQKGQKYDIQYTPPKKQWHLGAWEMGPQPVSQ